MKRILIILIILFSAALCKAQWVETGGPLAGDIRDLVISGTDIFAATPGGVYKSVNNGVSWFTVNNGLTDKRVLTLLVHGSSLFAGTDGSGVFVSTNGGTSWSTIPGFTYAVVNDLAAQGNFMYAATTIGMRVSNDNGATWTLSNSGLTNTNVNAVVVYDTTVIAGTSSSNGGIFLSIDNGQTWNISNTGLNWSTSIRVLEVIGQDIYCGTLAGPLQISNNSGASWVSVFSGIGMVSVYAVAGNSNNIYVSTSAGLFSCQSGGSCTAITIYTDMCNAQALLLAGNELYAGTPGAGIYKSDNNGANWTSVNDGLKQGMNITLASANGMLFSGDQCGMHSSADSGNTWLPAFHNQPGYGCYAIASINTDIFGAFYGSGMYHSPDYGVTWNQINNGLSSVSSKFIWDIKIIGSDIFIATQDGVYRSSNNGSNWTNLISGFNNTWIWSIENIGTTLFASAKDSVYKSIDNGNTWTTAATGLPQSNSGSNLSVIGNNLFIGYYNLGVYSSTDFGNSWVQSNNGLNNTNIQDLFSNGIDLFAGTNYSGIYQSNDMAASWTNISLGLSHYNITSFTAMGNTIFAGTSRGPIYKNNNVTTGIYQNYPDNSDINIFPNPTNQFSIIRSEKSLKNASIEIFNTLGEKVLALKNVSGTDVTIDCNKLLSGIYFVKITGKNEVPKMMPLIKN